MNAYSTIRRAAAVSRVEYGTEDDSRQRPRIEGAPDDGDAPETPVELASDLNRLQAAMQMLAERERRVLALRFGIDANGPSTLKEIGQRLSLTRERVRQIQNEALAKLSTQFDELRAARAS